MSDTSAPTSLGQITSTEIASQPDCWSLARAQAARNPVGLPETGERVLVLGCGTSYYVAAAYAWLREQSAQGYTDAAIASEMPTELRDYDRVVAISRSGTTTEVRDALSMLPDGMPITAILGQLDTPIAAMANDIIDLSYADERSVVQTRFPTTLLTLLRIQLGGSAETVSALIDAARSVVSAPASEQIPRQLVVLGSGWAAALAQEAALKCRESAGMWAEAYATGEYRHGPISVADSGTLVWAITPLTDTQGRAISETGARIHQGRNDPQVELVALQKQALAWAIAGGRNPDTPIHLTRSVTAP